VHIESFALRHQNHLGVVYPVIYFAFGRIVEGCLSASRLVQCAPFTGSRLMPTSFLEIVELPDGSIVLRRAEDEGVLVTLDFSEDAKVFLQGQHVEIAKAMFS